MCVCVCVCVCMCACVCVHVCVCACASVCACMCGMCVWCVVVGDRRRDRIGMSTHINPLPTNDAPMRHDLCELSISLWEFIWGF